MIKLIVSIGKATGTFIAKNWPIITAASGGMVAGVYAHKYQKPIVTTTKKTGRGIAFPFTWSYGKIKGLFSKKSTDETS